MCSDKVEYITPNQAVDIMLEAGLGEVTTSTIYNWAQRYKLGFKLGGGWRIDKQKFKAFLKGQKKQ